MFAFDGAAFQLHNESIKNQSPTIDGIHVNFQFIPTDPIERTKINGFCGLHHHSIHLIVNLLG